MLTGQALVDVAKDLATVAHKGQTRSDVWKTPYIRHPERVAGLFAGHWAHDVQWRAYTEGPFKEPYCRGLALALLHDSIEDRGITWADLRAAGLGELEDELAILTRGEEQSYLAYLLAIRDYRHLSNLPWLVKLCDIEDNVSDLGSLRDRRRAKWLATKYEMAEYILRS